MERGDRGRERKVDAADPGEAHGEDCQTLGLQGEGLGELDVMASGAEAGSQLLGMVATP